MRILSRLGVNITPTVGSLQLGDNSSPGALYLGADTPLQRSGANVASLNQLDQAVIPVQTKTQTQNPAVSLTTSGLSTTIPLLSWTIPYNGFVVVNGAIAIQYQSAGVNVADCWVTSNQASLAFAPHAYYRTEGTANPYGTGTIPLLAQTNLLAAGTSLVLYAACQNGTGGPTALIFMTSAIAMLFRQNGSA